MSKSDISSLHTFAVCAYKKSPYLCECLESLRAQTTKSRIIVATSTPSDYLAESAAEFGAEYCVNADSGKGIAADWNFALHSAKTPYCTITHQDDLYLPEYAARVTAALDGFPDSLICFTDYADRLMPTGTVVANRLYLHIKRLLLLPFYVKHSHSSRFFKRWILRFGNAVCCPSVTYNLRNLSNLKFDADFSVNLDWAMWVRLADMNGRFCFAPGILMQHRISDLMETSSAISDKRRYEEDKRIFHQLWPHPVAEFLLRLYIKSYESN